ncbi:glycosyltransferase family protein [Rhodophyticola sp.]|uniref:glycosyltransferase family protein n=1 Tax=Rhodophyticola sp. TaxID=2680032 RepID=UPI003D276BC3
MIPDIQFLSKLPISGHGTTEMRCVQPARYLEHAGWSASVGCVYRTMPHARRAIVFHRVMADPMGLRAMRLARAMECRVVYDVDDLLFDGAASAHLARFTSELESDLMVAGYRQAMELSDTVICSTTYLRDIAARFHPHVVVMKNGLSDKLIEVAQAKQRVRPVGSADVTLGYFSGSRHHDADFAVVQQALLKLMRDFPQTRLLLAGKLQFDPAFRSFGDRFEFREFVPYAQFLSMPGEVDINLVPLVHRDPFAQARSELKYIEAGVFGVPTVASPTHTYAEAISHGQTGMICADEDWYETLLHLVADTDLRKTLGQAARRDVIENHGPAQRVGEWDKLFREVLQTGDLAQKGQAVLPDRLRQRVDINRRALRRLLKSIKK